MKIWRRRKIFRITLQNIAVENLHALIKCKRWSYIFGGGDVRGQKNVRGEARGHTINSNRGVSTSYPVKLGGSRILYHLKLTFYLFNLFHVLWKLSVHSALWHKPHCKWEIKEFAKMTTSPPIFERYELFQIEYLDTTFGQFHFLAYIWSKLIIQRRQTFLIALFSWNSDRLAERCKKVRVQLNKTAANIYDDPGEKKIFEKYLPREGLVC